MFRAHNGALCIAITLLFAAIAEAGPHGIVHERREKDREAVNGQRAADKERIESIKKEMREFIEDVNGRLGRDNRMRFREPVDIDDIDDIDPIDHIHSRKKIADREYAYTRGERVALRSEGNARGREIGYLDFRERVEVLAQSDRYDTVRGVSAPWVLVRRSTGDEGWVFGAFLGKTVPERREELDTLDKKETRRIFDAPLNGTISSRYGSRVNPVTRRRDSFHRGIDIAAPLGMAVRSSAGGIVRLAEFHSGGYGNLVVIEHDRELSTYYGHLDEIRVKQGQEVPAGHVVGTVGKTGRATGPHLHFEVRRGGSALDPEDYLR